MPGHGVRPRASCVVQTEGLDQKPQNQRNTRPNGGGGDLKNRTIFTGDNLDIMRGIPDGTFDLIYLDPPFNSKHDYAAPIGSKAAGAAFKDTWTLSDIDTAWFGQIAEKNNELYKVIDVAASMKKSGASMQSYLIYMSIRILEMHRTLKDTGCLYLHCDPTMSHYLKLVLDSIFGLQNFQNDCIWAYRTGGVSKRRWARKHDNILFYSKDETRYAHNPLKERVYYDKPFFTSKIDEGGKYYADVFIRNVWDDIKPIINTSKERVGYPTQKPVALLERIIEASSRKGDMVFDPFCGCATSCLAAEKLDRQWVGIDISPRAFDLINDRLEQEAGMDKFIKGAGIVIHRTDIPKRKGVRTKQIKHILYGLQKGHCNGCEIHYLFKDLEIDHIVPKIRGGQDDDSNLQLLCGNCNRVKGSRLTMEELRARLQKATVPARRG